MAVAGGVTCSSPVLRSVSVLVQPSFFACFAQLNSTPLQFVHPSFTVPLHPQPKQTEPRLAARASQMQMRTKDTPEAAGVRYSFWEGVERLANLFRFYPAPPPPRAEARVGRDIWSE